jgi:phenylpropionate dioxygenase-like ring-hydroxylating dioxygenase large terminal subunit
MTTETSFATVDPTALARGATLPAVWYTEPEVLALEGREIFARAWQYVGPAGYVERPRQFMTADLGPLPVLVARDEEGALHAMANVCQHRGSLVAAGKGECKAFKCPYHGWSYGLDGTLKAAPWMEEKPDPSRFSLPRLKVAEIGPFVFAARADSEPFERYLGRLPERLAGTGIDLKRMRARHRIDYDIAANWKALVENFSECYHCPSVHPYFSKYVDLKTYDFDFGEFWFAQGGPDPRRTDPDRDEGAAVACGLFVQLWPNVMMNVYPGEENISAMLVVPISHERTRVSIDFCFGAEVSEAGAEDVIRFTDRQLREDWAIAESVQRGLASGAYRDGQLNLGVPAGRSEEGIRRFQARVSAALAGPLGAFGR